MKKKLLSEEELDHVTGGIMRIVDTGTAADANVRAGPGTHYSILPDTLPNNTLVYTTGNKIEADGKTWYEISSPVYGWIGGSLIGYRTR